MGIRPAARFRERHHTDGLAGQKWQNVFHDLLDRTTRIDALRTCRALLVVTSGELHFVPRQFLANDRRRNITEISATDRIRKYRAVEPGLAHFPNEIAREFTLPLDLVHDGVYLALHEAIDTVADCADLFLQHFGHYTVLYAITSLDLSFAISSSLKFRIDRKTSSVCSPNSGGGVSSRSGRSDNPIGDLSVRRSPAVGWGNVWTRPASMTSGLFNASSKLRTGPQGTLAVRSFSTQ